MLVMRSGSLNYRKYWQKLESNLTKENEIMSTSLDRLFEEAREDGSLRHWDIGDYVVVHSLNDLVGEVTKRSLNGDGVYDCLLYTSPSPRDRTRSRMPSSA